VDSEGVPGDDKGKENKGGKSALNSFAIF